FPRAEDAGGDASAAPLRHGKQRAVVEIGQALEAGGWQSELVRLGARELEGGLAVDAVRFENRAVRGGGRGAVIGATADVGPSGRRLASGVGLPLCFQPQDETWDIAWRTGGDGGCAGAILARAPGDEPLACADLDGGEDPLEGI